MNWWGKIIGGTIGIATMGPIGAVLGAAIGHLFDHGLDTLEQQDVEVGNTERTQAAFFTATFSIMGAMAKADGRVTREEIQLASSVMEQMQLLPEQKQAARELFNEGKQPDFPFHEVLQQFRRECHRRSNLIQMFLEIQIMTAIADGVLHHAEEERLILIAGELGFSRFALNALIGRIQAEQRFHQKHQQAGGKAQPDPAELHDAYEVLGIDETASDAEVKKAYRRLINQHHPDKLVSKGLPEEMMQIAKQKSQEITTAYNTIKKARSL